jgi:hypothetical protein
MITTKLEFVVDDSNRIDIDLWNDRLHLLVYNKGADGQWHVRAGLLLPDKTLTALIRTLKEKQKELRG